ncbi:HD domain-containing protein [Streptococcus equinus]|uniref:HD domain-containing protein n=1 Tax=Streptococcus equinus TaxID=1335 RepID=UPI00088F9CB1|nr:HD domain-containing protein [Streptococcus equinus]SDI60435.1 HD domain-containing protein [Streptococcus equinus]SEP71371.1 HD domain-containing protein [Streptococcus equinus]
MRDDVKLAHEIAKRAHKGQVDKAGAPYILHPETVASFVTKDDEKIVAYLHDVIEDTPCQLRDLENAGFSSEIIKAVDLLTRKTSQSYKQYLKLVKTNELARVVKLADLKHNSDLSRLTHVTENDIKRLKKYQDAIVFLST